MRPLSASRSPSCSSPHALQRRSESYEQALRASVGRTRALPAANGPARWARRIGSSGLSSALAGHPWRGCTRPELRDTKARATARATARAEAHQDCRLPLKTDFPSFSFSFARLTKTVYDGEANGGASHDSTRSTSGGGSLSKQKFSDAIWSRVLGAADGKDAPTRMTRTTIPPLVELAPCLVCKSFN